VSVWDSYFKKEVGPGWGWASMILPELEQLSVYDQIDFGRQIQDPVNQTARTMRLGVFFCPSDDMPRVWTATEGDTWYFAGQIYSTSVPICDVAGSNYVGVFGVGEPGVDGDGVFYRNSFVRPADIKDGMSHTIIVGERSVRLNLGRSLGTWVGAVP